MTATFNRQHPKAKKMIIKALEQNKIETVGMMKNALRSSRKPFFQPLAENSFLSLLGYPLHKPTSLCLASPWEACQGAELW